MKGLLAKELTMASKNTHIIKFHAAMKATSEHPDQPPQVVMVPIASGSNYMILVNGVPLEIKKSTKYLILELNE